MDGARRLRDARSRMPVTEDQKARRRAQYEANRERVLERQRAYYRANPEKFKEYQRKRYEANRDKILDANRSYRKANRERYNLERRVLKYGITAEQYGDLLRAQGGRCAICGTDSPAGIGGFHIDHCHATGRVRGLLCHHCNILAASAHLERHMDAVIAYLRPGMRS